MPGARPARRRCSGSALDFLWVASGRTNGSCIQAQNEEMLGKQH